MKRNLTVGKEMVLEASQPQTATVFEPHLAPVNQHNTIITDYHSQHLHEHKWLNGKIRR
jgi:hypothetical protein